MAANASFQRRRRGAPFRAEVPAKEVFSGLAPERTGPSCSASRGGFSPAISSAGHTNSFEPRSVTVADFNNDGRPDLATAMSVFFSDGTASGCLYVWLGKGDGTFLSPTHVSAGLPLAVAAGDFNNDHNSDLVVTYDHDGQSGFFQVLLGDGLGGFTPAGGVLSGSNSALAVGDLNGGGNPDAAAVAGGGAFGDAILGKGAGELSLTSSFYSR